MSDPDELSPGFARAHRLRRMAGRDPHEEHRVATPLELLFDLTFVIAFGISASEFAHLLAEDHVPAGLLGFVLSTFAICWAWINFSWFASAYDTDDWIYRIMTMVQMVGVIVMALGFPSFYTSIEDSGHVDNTVVVAGYIVMRIAQVGQWLRAARQDPERRAACLTYVTAVAIAQVGWIALMLANTSVLVYAVGSVVLVFVELMGPYIAETRTGGTPWHSHHIAERYGLLAIIALGEGVVGTVATISAAVGVSGWSTEAVLLAVAGTGLTFGMWWLYFLTPAADLLHAHREASFRYGYAHMLVFGSIIATGAGLHVAAYYAEHHSKLGSVGTVLSVAVPVGLYIASTYLIYVMLLRAPDVTQLVLVAIAEAVLVGSVLLAKIGVSMVGCLLVVTAAPVVVVVGYEAFTHRNAGRVIERRLAG